MHVLPTTSRRRSVGLALGAVLLASVLGAPAPAGAAPTTADEAAELAEDAAQRLTVIDEQVHSAEILVAEQQELAEAAAAAAAAAHSAVAAYEPQLRAIAESGYTGPTQSRVAAFLSSETAAELVQRMTTLDLIADHTADVISEVAAAQDAAEAAQAEAEQAAATAEAGLGELEQQREQLQTEVADYEADFARLTAEEQAEVTAALAGPTLQAPTEVPPAPTAAAGAAVQAALAQIGDPYVWGGTGPDGFDCSGLTSYAYGASGVALPHSSRAQSTLGVEVARDQLQPGDLVFFYEPISHVGLYIGNGMMVHARTFGQPVAVTSVDQFGYRFGRRIG